MERELATIGSLVGLGEDVNGQLRSHLTVMKKWGLTDKGLAQLKNNISPIQAENMQKVWGKVK